MTAWLHILALGVALAQDIPVPPLAGHVNDLTGTLSSAQITALEQRLAAFEKSKGSQVIVLVVPSAKPETIEQYSIRVAESWKAGRKSIDDGVILLIAKQDKKLRIEVGYGLEGVLPDATTKHIVDEVIAPRFRVGDFFGGVDAGTEAIIGAIKGEALPAPLTQEWSAGRDDGRLHFLLLGFFVVTAIGFGLRSLLGRLPAALVVGGVATLFLKLFITGIVFALIGGMVMFVLTLLGGVSRGGPWPGSIGGSGWGGGGVGGGFSGGGGGFGGGGASGSW